MDDTKEKRDFPQSCLYHCPEQPKDSTPGAMSMIGIGISLNKGSD